MSSCSKIRHIVRLRQMLRRWRRKASMASAHHHHNKDAAVVPAGHVAVSVGSNGKKYVVRTSYLNHPIFRRLLVRAEEEYGFQNTGPLTIPCDEATFEDILRFLDHHRRGNSLSSVVSLEDFENQRYCHVGFITASNLDSVSLLNKAAVW